MLKKGFLNPDKDPKLPPEVRFIVQHSVKENTAERNFFEDFFERNRGEKLSLDRFIREYTEKLLSAPTIYEYEQNNIDAAKGFLRATAAKVYLAVGNEIWTDVTSKDLEKMKNPVTLQACLSKLRRRAKPL